MNYFKHHIGDYAGATEHLTWDEDLAYTRLLRVYYRDEKPIPADLKQASRLVRAATAAQRRAVESVLKEFFRLEADGWRNKRADEELEADQAFIAKQRANGVASAAKRAGNGGPPTVKPPLNGGRAEGQPPTPTPTPISPSRSSLDPTVSANLAPATSAGEEEGEAEGRGKRPDLPPPQDLRLDELVSEEVSREALAEWQAHRKALKRELKPHELIVFGKVLQGIGSPSVQLETVRHCISNGWGNLRATDRPITRPNDPLAGVTWRPTEEEDARGFT